MQRIEHISQRNQACQPTDESALSLRADALSKNIFSSNSLLYWADAAWAVSVFAFLILLVFESAVVSLFFSFLFILSYRTLRLYVVANGWSDAVYNLFAYVSFDKTRSPLIPS